MEQDAAKLIPCIILSCLVFSDTHFYFQDEIRRLYMSPIFNSITDSLLNFYKEFDAEYQRIIEKVYEDPSFMKSKSRFLSKIGSRCLKMSDDPTCLSFLLMCAFIGHVLSFCYKNGKCYRIAESACKCAVAIYQRKFHEYFNRRFVDELKGFCDYLNLMVFQLQGEYADLGEILCSGSGGKHIVTRLLYSCIDVDSSQYILNDYERNILYRATRRRLRKLKPNLDFLILRIPKKYFNTWKNQDKQNVSPNASGSDSQAIASNQNSEFCLSDYSQILQFSSVSDSCLSPIDYSMKREFKSLNGNITENQSELHRCHTFEEPSKLLNYSIENPSEELNRSSRGNESYSLDSYISEKRLEPSRSCVIEKNSKLSNSYFTEMEIEPLNYCISKKSPEPSSKETKTGGSLSMGYHERRQEMHSENCESSNKQRKSSTWSPRKLEGSFSMRSKNEEFSNKREQIRNPDSRQIGTSPEADTVSVPKKLKTSKSPENKLALETKNEIKPLNYCMSIKDPGLFSTETKPDRSLPLAHYETSQEIRSENCESLKNQLVSFTWSHCFSARSMNSEFSNKGDQIRSYDNSITGISQETNASSMPKRRKTFNSLENKLALETDSCFLQKELDAPNLNSCERTIYMPPISSNFIDELQNMNRRLYSMKTELPKRNPSKCLIPLGEEYSIQNQPSTSSSNRNFHPLELQTKPKFPSSTIPSTSKCLMPSSEANSIENRPSTSSYNRNYLPSELQMIFPSISNFPIPSGEDNNIQNQPSTSYCYRNSLPPEFQTIFPSSSIIPSIGSCLMPSGEDNISHDIPSKRFSDKSSLPLELHAEAILPPTGIDSSQKSVTNPPQPPQDQNLAEVHRDKPSLNTKAAMSLVSYGFDGPKRKRNRNSVSSLSSDSSSAESDLIEDLSGGYYTSDSDISDRVEDKEFHYLPPFHSFQESSLDNSPSASDYYEADWEGDTTLKNLMSHQCFHCRTKCFNYVMHAFRQYTYHFIDDFEDDFD